MSILYYILIIIGGLIGGFLISFMIFFIITYFIDWKAKRRFKQQTQRDLLKPNKPIADERGLNENERYNKFSTREFEKLRAIAERERRSPARNINVEMGNGEQQRIDIQKSPIVIPSPVSNETRRTNKSLRFY